MSTEKTVGERRVRVDFNVAQSGNVHALKSQSAKLIDILEEYKNDPRNEVDDEGARLVATAQTKIEEAAMWAVKAVTK
jgi:hypothetical protein